MREHKTRDWVRRRGSDMTNALLYAAFAIIVLIAILVLYQTVSLNHYKKEASEIMTRLGAELETIQKTRVSWTAEDYVAGRTTGMVMDRMNLDPALRGEAEGLDVIRLPYGGMITSVTFPFEGAPYGLAGNGMAFIIFPENSRNATALCTYLASGPEGVLMSGPLGSDYAIMGKGCDGTVKAIQISYGAATDGFTLP